MCMSSSRVSAVKSSILYVLFTAAPPAQKSLWSSTIIYWTKEWSFDESISAKGSDKKLCYVASVLSSLDPCLPLAKGTVAAQLNPESPGGDGLNIPSVWVVTLATNLPLSLSLFI